MNPRRNKRAPKHTTRFICAKAGSPTSREGAPCRARWYPWRSQEEQGGMFLGQRLTFTLKGMREQEHADNAVINRRRERLMHCKTRTIWVKLDCLKPNLQSGRRVPHRYHVLVWCHSVQR